MENQTNALFPFSLEQLNDFIVYAVEIGVEKGVKKAIDSVLNNNKGAGDKPKYETVTETAKRLRVSPQTVADMTKKGQITGYRFGTRILYLPEQVEAALIRTDRYEHTGRKRGPKPKNAQQ